MSIAVSGLKRTTGPLPATPPDQPLPQDSGVYQAVTVAQSAQPSGGVTATLTPVLPSYVPAFDATAQSVIAAPNVDEAGQFVTMIEARAAFGASLAAFKAADANQKSLLDLIA